MRTSLSDVSAKLAALEAEHAAAQEASLEQDAHQASAIAVLEEQLHAAGNKLASAQCGTSVSQQALADVSAALAATNDESAALRLETEGLRATLHAESDKLQHQAAQADTWESECLGEGCQACAFQKVFCGLNRAISQRDAVALVWRRAPNL